MSIELSPQFTVNRYQFKSRLTQQQNLKFCQEGKEVEIFRVLSFQHCDIFGHFKRNWLTPCDLGIGEFLNTCKLILIN